MRPYTYSHNTIVLNYAHNNQSMAHLWGANFREAILIGRYNYKRWFADAKFIFGVRGFDFNDGTDNFSYGGDVYRDYNDRPFDACIKRSIIIISVNITSITKVICTIIKIETTNTKNKFCISKPTFVIVTPN